MQHIYSRILDKIVDADYDVYSNDVKASKLEKIWISLGVWVKYSLVY
jgi:phytoene/squalene synthetase